jgi:large-conductance mechanosensitive channel
MTQATENDNRLDRIEGKLDKLGADVDKLAADVIQPVIERLDRLTHDVEKLTSDNEKFNDRFGNYQQATQWVVQLAFTLIASATITVIITSILRK